MNYILILSELNHLSNYKKKSNEILLVTKEGLILKMYIFIN